MTSPKPSIHDLPELPVAVLELGGRLEYSPTEPVITIRPPIQTEPWSEHGYEREDAVAHCPPIAERYRRRYVTQVIYPRVTCYPLTAPTDRVVERAVRESRRDDDDRSHDRADRFVQRMRFYKLSSFQEIKLAEPYYCTVHGGPWSATVTETQSCDVVGACQRAPNRWVIEVSGLPELGLVWEGTWEDIPLHVHPTMSVLTNDLHLVSESWECCPGFRRCEPNGPCIDQVIPCTGNDPV